MIGPLQVVWFKRDLRVTDHRPLLEAARRGPVLCLYLLERELYLAPDFAPRQLEFAWSCVHELDSSLGELGASLTVLEGEAVEILERIRQSCGIAGLWAHQETGGAVSYARDRRVRRWARENGVAFTEYPQSGVVRRLETRDGWHERWLESMRAPVLPAPTRLEGLPIKSGSRSVCTRTPFASVLKRLNLTPDPCTPCTVQPGGRRAALELLESFLGERGVDYSRQMSSPLLAPDACSRLSPHLVYGTLSLREVYKRALEAKRTLYLNLEHGEWVDPRRFSALASFLSRLEWRDHFTQKLEDEPALEFHAIHPSFETLQGDFDPERFAAFQAGQTGFPLVDACVRSLKATGWLNFRMRAMLTSFAAYHLWLDWRRTGQFLARGWTDFEPGIHWPQMQMQSGVTGINTLRMYSPAKQAREHDPQGHFIRRWVPELESVPLEYLPEPQAMPPLTRLMSGAAQESYPQPIVNETRALERAKSRIYALRALPSTRAENAGVVQRHASRKPFRARPRR